MHLPFTRDTWRGRIRATRGIGASLPPERVAAFDAEHELVLATMVPLDCRVRQGEGARAHRVRHHFTPAMAAYNLIRLPRLLAEAA